MIQAFADNSDDPEFVKTLENVAALIGLEGEDVPTIA